MDFYTNFYHEKSYLYIKGYRDGEGYVDKVKMEPFLFVESEDGTYKSIKGKKLRRIDFDSYWDAVSYLKQYSDVDNMKIYGFTGNKWKYSIINEMYPGKLEYDASQIVCLFFDIEVSSKDGFPSVEHVDQPLVSVSFRFNDTRLVFGVDNFIPPKGVKYVKCSDEKELLSRIVKLFKHIKPDVLSGWFVEMFDVPYMIRRMYKVLGESVTRELSPFGIINEKSFQKFGKTQIAYEIAGMSVLDYMDLYKSFSYGEKASYKLDDIAYEELGIRKIDYSEYGTIQEFYEADPQKFLEYNMRDVDLVYDLDQKFKFLDLVYSIAYDAKVNFQDALTTVNLWDVIIHNHLMEKGIAVEPMHEHKLKRRISGGFVKTPSIGRHKYVASFDLTSLYPHLIMQYNISPETYIGSIEELIDQAEEDGSVCVDRFLNGYTKKLIDKLKKANVGICVNGTLYSNEQRGFLPELMDMIFRDRKKHKMEMINAKSELEEVEKELERRGLLES